MKREGQGSLSSINCAPQSSASVKDEVLLIALLVLVVKVESTKVAAGQVTHSQLGVCGLSASVLLVSTVQHGSQENGTNKSKNDTDDRDCLAARARIVLAPVLAACYCDVTLGNDRVGSITPDIRKRNPVS